MRQLESMNDPTHQDFLKDPNLSLAQIGALALMTRSIGPFTGDWLFQTRPATTRGSVGRTRSQGIMRGLKDRGYADAKTVRVDGVTRICTSIRGSLDLPFCQSGPLIDPEEPPQIIASSELVPLKIQPNESSGTIVIQPEVIEAELMEDQEVSIVTAKAAKKSRKPTIAEQMKATRQDVRFVALLEAYREMLKGISKIGNLGSRDHAAREFLNLLSNPDPNATLMGDILTSLPRYQVACNGFPVSLMRYLRDRVWEDHPPEPDPDWSAFHE